MKRILVLGLFAVILVYAVGYFRLGESGAMRFVMEMDDRMTDSDAGDVCDLFHEDLEVDITDSTAGQPRHMTGGKTEFCAQSHETAAGLKLLPHNSRVQFDDVRVKRDWLHPWTSEVSYTEDRHLTIPSIGQTFHTLSEDTLVLVHTFSGVKLRKVHAEASLAE